MSSVELSVPGAYEVLKDVLNQKRNYDGILFFSLFTLPTLPSLRNQVYKLVSEHRKTLHFCLEQLSVETTSDLSRIEDLLCVREALRKAPLAAKYWSVNKTKELTSFMKFLGIPQT